MTATKHSVYSDALASHTQPNLNVRTGTTLVNVVLHLSLSADVTVTGKRTFANLADVENPAENLVGIAQSASQGAITARQLDERPLMRDGEVLETVPGAIVTQHSGEGKANQYFLRGFNLDHGTDFATTVAGMPINLPTHAHGQGYSDLNFLIPELVSGVQFSKGPYYADQGDFATAGSSNINYANVLDRSIAHAEAGGERYVRGLFAASPQVGRGHVVAPAASTRRTRSSGRLGFARWLDSARFHVDALDTANSGTTTAGLVSPKGGATVGPWKGTEFYVNAGMGYHSNDARGTTITRNPDGNPVDRVTPLVRARGAEVGMRTVAIPHFQSTVSVWMLRLSSELMFSGDDGTTVPSRPSARRGVEWANYYRPMTWLVLDGDLSWSRAHFTAFDPVGDDVPEAVGTVVSAGATIDGFHKAFGSLRWRYFGPRTLIEDNSVRSRMTSLVNLQTGYQIMKSVKLAVDVFNLFNASDSDIDYFYTSRLPGEPPEGVDDIHTHPTLPRTARVNVVVGF